MCGKSFHEKTFQVNISLCNKPCPGNSADMCGGVACVGRPSYLSFFNLSKKFLIKNIFFAIIK
jgi:hypothetical protein